jgi:signal peptidase I
MSHSTQAAIDTRSDLWGPSLARQTVEFLIVLTLSILLFRTFAAEAYIVPTGSMAPTLLGDHEEIVCSNCGIRFALGLDEDAQAGRPTCPNCGTVEIDGAAAVVCSGDRVLVQKFLYDFRRPQRWEVAVFHFPGEPTQAYVKRVVGLPGEAIQIVRGDVVIDGRVARKTLAEQRAMRILVYDHHFMPRDAARYPRWTLRRGRPWQGLTSRWQAVGDRFVHEPTPPAGSTSPDEPPDWIEYRHWGADRGRYAPISDFNAYNGGEMKGENPISDLMMEADLTCGEDVRDITLRIRSAGDRFTVTLPVGNRGPVSVQRNWREIAPVSVHPRALAALTTSRTFHVEFSAMDRRLLLAINGDLLFDPIDFDDPAVIPSFDTSPVALGVRGGSVTVAGLRIYRDVHYTSALASVPRRPFGVDSPYLLGRDEFFVLGDNSPVSNDSRFWADSPVVPGELFLGKPFLVHLPGQVVPLKVFGRSVYWVPDPREIRYIR